jgi:hypothetical protein
LGPAALVDNQANCVGGGGVCKPRDEDFVAVLVLRARRQLANRAHRRVVVAEEAVNMMMMMIQVDPTLTVVFPLLWSIEYGRNQGVDTEINKDGVLFVVVGKLVDRKSISEDT